MGETAEAAVKAACIAEDAAKTLLLAFQPGEIVPIAEEEVERLHRRYQQDYGQAQERVGSIHVVGVDPWRRRRDGHGNA
jgi:L-ribulose-5-phosphate 4-epimerase